MFKTSFMVESIKQQILEEVQKDAQFKEKFIKLLGIDEEIKRLEERINTLEDEIFQLKEEFKNE